jgi:hypothetical protein
MANGLALLTAPIRLAVLCAGARGGLAGPHFSTAGENPMLAIHTNPKRQRGKLFSVLAYASGWYSR